MVPFNDVIAGFEIKTRIEKSDVESIVRHTQSVKLNLKDD